MPLYEHKKSGRKSRTREGSRLDRQRSESKDWTAKQQSSKGESKSDG